jgi:hypothetical protein
MAFSNFFSNNPAFQQRLTEQLQAEANKKKQLEAAAAAAGNFAGQGEAGYGAMTGELAADRAYQRDIMTGKNSLSGEQLRQGLQQNMAAQRSMAASATPQNAVMASRNAMNNMNRAGIGMSGQAALAGIQERNAAASTLGQMNLGQRGQDIEVGLGSRQNQMTGLGANKPDKPKEPSFGQRLAMGAAAAAPILFSDERLKTDVKSGDSAARKAVDTLAAHMYRYKDSKHGDGPQLGVMAQALEKAGLKQAVIDTPEGKAVDHAKLTGANTAMIAALAKRMAKVEGK